ncbi:MAG: DUF3626 domain-containing protein [Elusimicrobiota bacterium]
MAIGAPGVLPTVNTAINGPQTNTAQIKTLPNSTIIPAKTINPVKTFGKREQSNAEQNPGVHGQAEKTAEESAKFSDLSGIKAAHESSILFDSANKTLPAPVAAANKKAATKEQAAQNEIGEFLRRSIAVERRNAQLKNVQEQIKTVPEERKKELIKESNRLQDLSLEALIDAYFPKAEADAAMENFISHVQNAELTINFDPNMKLPDGRSIIDGFMADGVYKNYAQTGVTQGIATKQRAVAEDKMFEGLAGAAPEKRPKYASVNVTEDPAGGAPRYSDYSKGEKGVYFVLKDGLKRRATLTARDTLDNMGTVPVGTFDNAAYALNDMPRENLLELFRWVAGGRVGPRPDVRTNPEVQIFDEVRLKDDVERMAAHRAYRGTPAEGGIRALAGQLGLRLVWY